MEINEGIRDREVRVIDADGSQLGIMSTRDALAKAEEKNLDLVKIAPQAQPPVCKFLANGEGGAVLINLELQNMLKVPSCCKEEVLTRHIKERVK